MSLAFLSLAFLSLAFLSLAFLSLAFLSHVLSRRLGVRTFPPNLPTRMWALGVRLDGASATGPAKLL